MGGFIVDMIIGSLFVIIWCAIIYAALDMYYEAEADRETNALRSEERSQ